MEFGPSLFCDQLSGWLVEVEACNLCALDPPTNTVVTACDHCFCWNCLHQFLEGQAKPCPGCSTMLSSGVNAAPTFDAHGVLVLHLPIAEEVEPNLDDDMLDGSCTAASAPARAEEEPIARRDARRDADKAVVVFNAETKLKVNGTCVRIQGYKRSSMIFFICRTT